MFEPFGEIAHVSVSHSSLTRQPSKVGIVQFFEAAAAAAAAKGLNGMSLLGKTMRVSIGGHEAVLSAVPSLAGSATSTNRLFLNLECDDEADSDLDLDAAPLISVHGLSADRLCPSAIVDVIRKARIGALVECAGVRLLPPTAPGGKRGSPATCRWSGQLRSCLVFALNHANASRVQSAAAALRGVLPDTAVVSVESDTVREARSLSENDRRPASTTCLAAELTPSVVSSVRSAVSAATAEAGFRAQSPSHHPVSPAPFPARPPAPVRELCIAPATLRAGVSQPPDAVNAQGAASHAAEADSHGEAGTPAQPASESLGSPACAAQLPAASAATASVSGGAWHTTLDRSDLQPAPLSYRVASSEGIAATTGSPRVSEHRGVSLAGSPTSAQGDARSAGAGSAAASAAAGSGAASTARPPVHPSQLIPPIDVPVNRIFISNLPPSVTDALVAALFAPFGPVVAVHVMRRFQSTASKGYGFVDMAGGRSAAIRAISALHGTRRADLGMHRALRVEFKCGPCTGGAHQQSGSRVQAGPFRGSDGYPRFSANAGIGRIGGGSGARAGAGQSVYGCSHGAAVAGPFFGGETGAGTGTQFGRTMAAPAAYGPADHSQHGAAFRRPGMTGHPGVAAAPMAAHGGPSYAQPMLFASRAGMGGNGAGGQSGGFGNNLEHGSDSQRPAGHPSQADNCQERRHPQQSRRHAQSVPSTEGAFGAASDATAGVGAAADSARGHSLDSTRSRIEASMAAAAAAATAAAVELFDRSIGSVGGQAPEAHSGRQEHASHMHPSLQ